MAVEQDYKHFLLEMGRQQQLFEQRIAEFGGLQQYITELENKAVTCSVSRVKLAKLNVFCENDMPALMLNLRERIAHLEVKFNIMKKSMSLPSDNVPSSKAQKQQSMGSSKKFKRNFL